MFALEKLKGDVNKVDWKISMEDIKATTVSQKSENNWNFQGISKRKQTKLETFRTWMLFKYEQPCWFTILFWAHRKRLYAFKTPWIIGLRGWL